ncbi:MAG: glycosyltransferase [Bacteroidia bacterium]
MIWIFYFTLGFLLIRLAVVVTNIITKPYLQAAKNASSSEPLISVLIPARNEEKNILTVLNDLKNQTYNNLEIIVLDDYSEDNTFTLAEDFFHANAQTMAGKIIKGEALPNSWLGKNWACNQLQKHASGEFLLFVDADVKLAPKAVESAYMEVQKNALDLLSLFPDQVLQTTGEKLVVPLMHYILLTLLPLRLIFKSKDAAFAAANGQFMFFRKQAYKNRHEQLKTTITEDIAILKQMKSEGYKTETLLGNRLVLCRMYTDLQDALNGFSKNLFAGFGNNIFMISLYYLLTLFFPGLIFFTLPFQYFLIIAALALLVKAGVSFMAKYNLGEQLFLHPLQVLIWFWLGVKSVYKTFTRQNEWKGRRI